jgi:glutamine synthetase
MEVKMPKMSREEGKEYVLKMAKEHDVKFIRMWFTDILGFLKNFAITVEELEGAMEEGMGFDGSSIEGFARIDESDMVAMPDPDTWRLLPWRSGEHRAVARMFCDVLRPGGEPFEGDPRYVLKRNLKRAADLGYTYYVGPELEYFYFKDAQGTEPLDLGGYFDLTPRDAATDMRKDTVLTLEQMGIGVEYSHHEVAPSQHEIDMRYTDALTMADSVMTYRLVVKEVALKYGVYATFMPKPVFGINGSGMHTHQSLFNGDKNATRIEFRSPDPACNPYLAFSVMLAAGLEGIEKGYEVPAPIEENVYEMNEEERQKKGISTLPASLLEAILLTEKSELVHKALGDHVFNAFIENKKIEWDTYRTQVTEFELKRYLPIL